MKNVITKDINISEMLEKYPQTREVLMNMGLGCVGCVASSFETLEEGLNAHELDVDETIKKLNLVIENKE
jgi:hybrid cluster-associated redox disulfide protein